MSKGVSERLQRPPLTLATLEWRENADSGDLPSGNSEGSYGDALFHGEAPARKCLFGGANCPTRVEQLCISESNLTKLSSVKSNLKREQPLLQDPSETFDKMNAIVHQTLKYVKEVESLDFSCANVLDFNGQIMEDPRRLFLSICTSIFANFSFCNPLDPAKVINFLSDLYDTFTTENAYHNPLHSADSLQILFLILREKPALYLFTDNEVIVLVLSTLCISFLHPGVTNVFLARIDHPLTLVYGDMMTQQSASLTAFLYLLNREENRFIDLCALGGSQPFSQFLRELLVETVIGTSPRLRAALLQDLKNVEASKEVSHDDVPSLMKAVVVLADNALALRPREQFLSSASCMLGEWLREACEEERRSMDSFMPNLRTKANEDGLRMISEYCQTWIKPLATAVHALMPQDLYDNVEKNAEPPSVTESVDFGVPSTSPDERWTDGSAPIVEILRKITMHASSLDRKASKRAILNATSNRQALSSVSSDTSSPQNSQQDIRPFTVENISGHQYHHSRSEHYFSFLRLYDTYEKEGRSSSEFAAQLVFLALQLSPTYIGRYARDDIDASSKEQCDAIAKKVMTNEEAPSTAEVIASPARDGQETDGFILRLMEMYAERDSERHSVTNNGPPSTPPNTRHPLFCHNPVYGSVPRGKKL